MHDIICSICKKKVTVKYTVTYCNDCRPKDLKRMQEYYRRRQKTNHAYQCPDCGKGVSQRERRCNRCAHILKRPQHLKGLPHDITMDTHGYYRIKINGKWIPQHRYIWEKEHGQKLPPNWQVHHLDGIKTNNTIPNLYACSISDHHSANFIKVLQNRILSLQKEMKILKSATPNHPLL